MARSTTSIPSAKLPSGPPGGVDRQQAVALGRGQRPAVGPGAEPLDELRGRRPPRRSAPDRSPPGRPGPARPARPAPRRPPGTSPPAAARPPAPRRCCRSRPTPRRRGTDRPARCRRPAGRGRCCCTPAGSAAAAGRRTARRWRRRRRCAGGRGIAAGRRAGITGGRGRACRRRRSGAGRGQQGQVQAAAATGLLAGLSADTAGATSCPSAICMHAYPRRDVSGCGRGAAWDYRTCPGRKAYLVEARGAGCPRRPLTRRWTRRFRAADRRSPRSPAQGRTRAPPSRLRCGSVSLFPIAKPVAAGAAAAAAWRQPRRDGFLRGGLTLAFGLRLRPSSRLRPWALAPLAVLPAFASPSPPPLAQDPESSLRSRACSWCPGPRSSSVLRLRRLGLLPATLGCFRHGR